MHSGLFVDHRELSDYDVGYILKKYREEVTPTKKGAKQERARLLAIKERPFACLQSSVVDLQDGARHRPNGTQCRQGTSKFAPRKDECPKRDL